MKATVLVSLALTAPPLFAGSPAMGNNDIVVSADVESSNGIILVIDRVMLPPGFSL